MKRGIAKDEAGVTLPGVNPAGEALQIRTAPDFNVSYAIYVTAKATTLVYSFFNIQTHREASKGQTSINIDLRTSVSFAG